MGFDYVFRGEGEESFVKFLLKFLNNEDLENVKGLSFIKYGDFLSHP